MIKFDERGNLLPSDLLNEFKDSLNAMVFWAENESDARGIESNLKSLVGAYVSERILQLKYNNRIKREMEIER